MKAVSYLFIYLFINNRDFGDDDFVKTLVNIIVSNNSFSLYL